MFSKKKRLEAQIEKLNSNVYELINSQRERIFALRQENANLLEELKGLRKKEEAIASALILANSKKRETEEMILLKKNVEIERLKIFSQKWQSYFESIFKLLPEDANMQKISEYNTKLKDILSVDQSSANATFVMEKLRLESIKQNLQEQKDFEKNEQLQSLKDELQEAIDGDWQEEISATFGTKKIEQNCTDDSTSNDLQAKIDEEIFAESDLSAVETNGKENVQIDDENLPNLDEMLKDLL